MQPLVSKAITVFTDLHKNMWENLVLIIFLFLFTSVQYTWYFVPSPELKSGFSLVPNWLYSFKAVLVYKVMTW